MIRFDDVTVTLAGRPVLQRVCATVGDGELVYLLGRNGAGKSTLLRTACGILAPSSGAVTIDGAVPPDHRSPGALVGVHLGADSAGSPSGPDPAHTGRRHLRWLAAAAGVGASRVDPVLRRVGLVDVADRRIGGYSLGMRQRLGIAAALLTDAPNLIFDEPVNGLDVDGIRWLRGLLRGLADEGRSVYIASHPLDEVARTGDRVLVLDHGRVLADAPVRDLVGERADVESAYLALLRPSSAVVA